MAEGALLGPQRDPDDGCELWTADFSAVAEPGLYQLEAPGLGRSEPFPISPTVHRDALRTVMLGFYGLRCGCGVALDHHGHHYQHGPCHQHDGLMDLLGQAGLRQDGTGGWHDAGDYNKYTVNTAYALGLMLKAWEDAPDALRSLDLPFLPEHGGVLPDFLAELKWGLDWLLRMQAPDGSAYHKLSALRFNHFELPDRELSPRYFSQPSSAATASLCGALAQAARVFQAWDLDLADRCRHGAAKAWAWLEAHPGHLAPDQQPFNTGAYNAGESRESSYRLWALGQWWACSQAPGLLLDLESRLRSLNGSVESDWDWNRPGLLGLLAYADVEAPGRDPATQAQVAQALRRAADALVAGSRASAYGRSLQGSYYWGSNGSVARAALLLRQAWRQSGDQAYLEVAAGQVGYLFGRNPYGRSQVTGLGVEPPMDPHHRPSGGDDVHPPWPGLLVGGGLSPADWRDERDSFRTNEVAINWQAALVYGLALLA